MSVLSTITAVFRYFVSCSFVVRFVIPGVTDVLSVLGVPLKFALATFPLGDAPFTRSAAVHVEVVDVPALVEENANLGASLGVELAHSASLSAELNGTRALLDSSNQTLAQTQSELRGAQAAAAGGVAFSARGVAIAGAAAVGLAGGWALGRRRTPRAP